MLIKLIHLFIPNLIICLCIFQICVSQPVTVLIQNFSLVVKGNYSGWKGYEGFGINKLFPKERKHCENSNITYQQILVFFSIFLAIFFPEAKSWSYHPRVICHFSPRHYKIAQISCKNCSIYIMVYQLLGGLDHQRSMSSTQ